MNKKAVKRLRKSNYETIVMATDKAKKRSRPNSISNPAKATWRQIKRNYVRGK